MNDLIAGIPHLENNSAGPDSSIGSEISRLHELQQVERHQKLVRSLAASWPIAVGLLLALVAPALSDFLTVLKPWGMWLVFPFVELLKRPELQMGEWFKQTAPQFMLYAQFPLEGLFAKKFLRGRVTVRGVALQVAFYHFLGAVQLAMVCGIAGGAFLH